MASISSRATTIASLNSNNKHEVYIAAMPLKAPKGPPQLLMSTIYSLNFSDLQHYMVIINTPSPPESAALVCHFQPKDPEDIFTAVLALSGRKIPGVVLTRKLKKLPRRKCWLVGYSELDAVEEVVRKFNEKWDTNLRIGYHDCRDYVNELAEYLTGEKLVLRELKKMQHH